jgi:hypothetical protein
MFGQTLILLNRVFFLGSPKTQALLFSFATLCVATPTLGQHSGQIANVLTTIGLITAGLVFLIRMIFKLANTQNATDHRLDRIEEKAAETKGDIKELHELMLRINSELQKKK